MSYEDDLERVNVAKDDLTYIVEKGRWIGVGVFLTVALALLVGWITLIVFWPVIFGIITAVLVLPFILGSLIILVFRSRLKSAEKSLNRKDESISI